ncbi:MAG TPA: 3-dehydroquinate synthase [Burkholderiales bacterium]|nr:3-dehydroquinate synthase [Burkholderiales bacterium]
METLKVDLGERSYPIYIGDGLLGRPELLLPGLEQKKAAVVTNTTVAELYLDSLTAVLDKQGVEVVQVVLPDGEKFKNWETLNSIFDTLLSHHCERKTALIAMGGGVIGDLAGFAAAVYMRGVPYIQIPTTLLAQVDSSIGGKTAINHPQGKNMIGAFYQPKLVLADTATLNTLPQREFSSGLAEVIKYGLIRDEAFFDWLDCNVEMLLKHDTAALVYAIRRSCENKVAVVAADERESGVRALLNLGHTFGHAIETGEGYGTWLHGEAIAVGTLLAAQLSRRMGLISEAEVQRITSIYRRARLPISAPDFGAKRYLQLMSLDKKVERGRIRFILLRKIGEAFITADVPEEVLTATLSGAAANA